MKSIVIFEKNSKIIDTWYLIVFNQMKQFKLLMIWIIQNN